ncbi:MAG: hypothetical protein H6830_10595 [Planctomycetes bacterium]|nr:hypothetical protein [Planctomycetota bacterium]
MSRSVHPLLLEPSYWNQRLSELEEGAGSMFSSPREDLSGSGREVEEFRLKTHDGQLLWGLIAYPTFFQGSRPCCIKAAGPAEPIVLDPSAPETGTVEILYQVPAGRRLEDRVVDLLRIYAQARRQPRIEPTALRLSETSRVQRDEFWIASELLRRMPPKRGVGKV